MRHHFLMHKLWSLNNPMLKIMNLNMSEDHCEKEGMLFFMRISYKWMEM
jgi:hypothetical protein